MRDLFTPDKKKSAKEKIAHELFKVYGYPHSILTSYYQIFI
jgi:hypothetical protein